MLDMGFEPQIKKVLLDVRPTRQTIMTRLLVVVLCYIIIVLPMCNE